MSRFIQYHVAELLGEAGWPRTRGLLRKAPYVPILLVDAAVKRGLQICMGLGAARPDLGARLIADCFTDEQEWSRESTLEILELFATTSENDIRDQPALLPWDALFAENPLRQFSDGANISTEIPATLLRHPEVCGAWGMLQGQAALWGLNHEADFARAFEQDRARWNTLAPEFVRHGLDVPATFPWPSLEAFFDWCEEIVSIFQQERGPLRSIPPALRTAPIVARRLIDDPRLAS